MDLTATATPEAAQATAETPVDSVELSASEKLLASKLSHEQAQAFVKNRKAAKARKPKAEAAAETASLVGTPASESEAETVTFGEPESPADDKPTTEATAEELTEADLAKLDEKTRKRITEVSKENAKIRKRAQEAEAALETLKTSSTQTEAEAAELRESLARSASLAGNAFSGFTDSHAVAAWGRNSQEALALLDAHQKLVEAGRIEAYETVTHKWPNGKEVELSAQDRALYERRITDASAWFERDEQVGKNREAAKSIEAKHEKLKGYAEARARYIKDATLGTRLEELAAKAALYDVLESRKANIHFPDTAGTAKKVPSPSAGDSIHQAETQTRPRSETTAPLPRVAPSGGALDDIKERKSALMQRAMNATNDSDRQRFLKEAIMLGNPSRITRDRGETARK